MEGCPDINTVVSRCENGFVQILTPTREVVVAGEHARLGLHVNEERPLAEKQMLENAKSARLRKICADHHSLPCMSFLCRCLGKI